MCGIIGLLLANEEEHVNQMLFDGLTVLQHRGQDAAGMMTVEQGRLRLRKDNGMVRDVFQLDHMTQLRGNVGIGHVRYPTAGSSSNEEAQPFSTSYPFGIGVAHNGNLTNTEQLGASLRVADFRHVNTDSDSEVLLNVFAESLTRELKELKEQQQKEDAASSGDDSGSQSTPRPSSPTSSSSGVATSSSMHDVVFSAMENVMSACKGGYAGVYLINGIGLVGFRDPNGIRPLVFGVRKSSVSPTTTTTSVISTGTEFDENGLPTTPRAAVPADTKLDFCIASESVVIDALGFKLVRDVRAGEAIFIDMDGNCHSKIVHAAPTYHPCIFEFVYFARPDSIMDGVSVYEARLNMGEKLAETILKKYPDHDIDVVIPIPDTSRTSALQTAYRLDRPFREGFMKNRYIGRTFIMPGQAKRKKSVRLKLNTIRREFEGKNVLLVDDSIVRGTTAGEIVQMALEAGAKKVYFSSAAPPIRFPNIYGIDLPTQEELIAFGRTEEQIAEKIGCEWVVYQELEDLEESVRSAIPKDHEPFDGFDCSTFSGEYITGERVGDDYFTKLHVLRNDSAKQGGKNKAVVKRSSSIVSNNSSRRSPPTVPSVLVPRSSSHQKMKGLSGGGMTDSDSSDDEKKTTTTNPPEIATRVSERIPLPTF